MDGGQDLEEGRGDRGACLCVVGEIGTWLEFMSVVVPPEISFVEELVVGGAGSS